MNTVLIHRDPDNGGVWTDGPIGLGNLLKMLVEIPCTLELS
jgi:hypothetical protein